MLLRTELDSIEKFASADRRLKKDMLLYADSVFVELLGCKFVRLGNICHYFHRS